MERKDANIVELDVRPQLRKKLEPFQLIMDAVKRLDANDIFVLHATLKPTPLISILKLKGLLGKSVQISKDHWVSTFVNKKNKSWLEDLVADESVSAVAESLPDSDNTPSSDSDRKSIVLDNRGLEPPKPMMRTLHALERCRPGDEVVIHNDRVPMFLIEELHNLGYPYTVEEQPDGSAKVRIHKA